MEKQKRKVEGELRLAQESLDQLDRERKETEVTLCRKNKEIAALAQKLEREQSNVIKCEKQIKECGVGHFATVCQHSAPPPFKASYLYTLEKIPKGKVTYLNLGYIPHKSVNNLRN